MIKNDKNTRDHLVWSMRIPCTRCVSHTGYFEDGNSKGEIRGRSRHRNSKKKVVRNLEENNVDTIKGVGPNKA